MTHRYLPAARRAPLAAYVLSWATPTAALVMVAGTIAAACADDVLTSAVPSARMEAITATSVTGTVGAEVEDVPAVRVTDKNGAPIAGVVVTFQAPEGSGVVGSRRASTAGDGSATVGSWWLGHRPGTQSLVASSDGLRSVRFTATAAPGPPSRLLPVSGNSQIARVGEDLPQPLIARVVDEFGNAVAGVPVTFQVTDGGGRIDGDPVVADSEGLAASGRWTLAEQPGVQHVSAAIGDAQLDFWAYAVAPPSGLLGRIVFVSLSGSSGDIAVVNADGSGFTRIAHPGSDLQPVWSPDGNRIAFASDSGGDGQHLYVMAGDGTNLSPLTDGPWDGEPAWSPDGSSLAFTSLRDGSGQIASLRIADGAITVLTDLPGYEGQASWSPDGRQFAFVSDYAAYDIVYDIYTMNSDGTSVTQRTTGFQFDGLSYYLHPAWSPDGSMVAFVLGEVTWAEGTTMHFHVTLMSADGVLLKRLAWAGDIPWDQLLDPGSLTWSPDGRYVAYTFIDGEGVRSVKYVAIDGSQEGTIAAQAHSPSWTW